MFLVLGLILSLLVLLSSGCVAAQYKYGSLTALADKYKTDKGTSCHLYTEVYEYFFLPLKYKALKVCEIGVAEGASIKMLRDFFPNAVIYGIDVQDMTSLNSDRMKIFIADQADRNQLKSFTDACGGDFDIIIDDGGHTMKQQQVSFAYLFPYLKRGGYYIIEEVQSSIYSVYGTRYEVERNEENATLTMINNFMRTGQIKSKYMTPEEENDLAVNIAYCNFFNRHASDSMTCIFKKK
jgi:hypothetical protein